MKTKLIIIIFIKKYLITKNKIKIIIFVIIILSNINKKLILLLNKANPNIIYKNKLEIAI